MSKRIVVLQLTLLALPLGCRSSATPEAAPKSRPAEASKTTEPPRAPSQWEVPGQWVVLRDHDGKAAALVSVGSSKADARPLVVSVHGSQSNAEWNCPKVRETFGPTPWIVCPHPTPHLGTDASWLSAKQIADAIERSVGLLIEKVGVRADAKDAHFIGHSQGAVQGPLALGALHGVHFKTITLFEGPPYHAPSVSALIAKAAPDRVLLISGSSWGIAQTRELGRSLGTAGIPVHSKETGTGHFFEPRIYDEVHAELPWLMPNASLTPPPVASDLAKLDGYFADEIFHDGKRIALVDVPADVAEPRPVVVAAHAAGVGPHWICAAARMVFGPRPIILCPDDAPSRRTIADLLSAAQLRFGSYLRTENAAYFGYSQGAMLSPAIWPNSKLHFTSALLLEGLPTSVVGVPKQMQDAGLERVWLVSGQGGWAAGHAKFAAALQSQGIDARHLGLAFGHVPNDAILKTLIDEGAWLKPPGMR